MNRQIPIVDQAVFNQLVYAKPYADIVRHSHQEDDWACQAAVVIDPAKTDTRRFLMYQPPMLDNGTVRNANGKPYVIVHQYDRDPVWNDAMLRRYGDPAMAETDTVLRPAAFARG